MNEHTPGLRHRFLQPSPPAPVPKPRPAADTDAETPVEQEDRSSLTRAPEQPAALTVGSLDDGVSNPEHMAVAVVDKPTKTSDSDVVRSTGSMAVATLLSRITGFIRTAMVAAALGGGVAGAFTTANTLPNLVTEIVLGSVLTALVVPVLVRAEKEDPDKGAAFIRRLFTLTLTLVTVVTLVAVVGAPALTRMMLNTDGEVNVGMSTSFAYLLLPQIFFYGLFSLFMAILNTKSIFKPGAWAPVANNIISIAVLALYMVVPGRLHPTDPGPVSDPHVLLLGVGTTLGVVVQCAIMFPYLRKAGIDLRPLWGLDERLKQFGGMAVAIVVYVAISQLGYVINNRIASGADESAIVIYSYHWLLLQMPYGIIGVTLLTAIMPRLSRNAADGDDKAVVRDLTLATKLTFIALIPIVVFFTGFGVPISHVLFQHGLFTPEEASILGLTICFSAFTLIPYALVMLHLRVFYAREDAWTPTYIVAGITVTKIVLALLAPMVATSPAHVVILLGAANGFGYIAGAMVGGFLLRRKLGSLQLRSVAQTTAWALGSSIIGMAGAFFVVWVINQTFGSFLEKPSLIAQLCLLGVIGVVFLIVTGIVLSRSKLPEVQNLGRLFARIPGLRRFITIDDEKAIQIDDVDEPQLTAQLFSYEAFNATPIPPPMSAGVVRGPKLVPGAPVSDGSFRLLAECGNVSGAQFWKAHEKATGKDVALTFIDTSGQAPLAALSPAEMARSSAEISKNTRKLGELDHPAIADNIRILSYRTGALIVSDWVPGSSLRDVAETAADPDTDVKLNPKAVAGALAPLAEAAADAQHAGTALGLDNSSRIRISTDGAAILAFPGVLPDASAVHDAASIASAIQLLASATTEDGEDIDPELGQIAFDARAVAEEAEQEEDPEKSNALVRDIAARLRAFAMTPDATGAEPDEEEGDDVRHVDPRREAGQAAEIALERALRRKAQQGEATFATDSSTPTGFGSRGYSRTGLTALIGGVVAFVVIAAVATAFITSYISGDSDSGPVNQESIQGSQSTTTSPAPSRLPIYITPDHISVWHAPGTDPSEDNPQDVDMAIDGDSNTSWSSDSYPNGLGTKPGVGLAVTVDKPISLKDIYLHTSSPGTHFSVYLLPAGMNAEDVQDLNDIPRLATGETRGLSRTIKIDETGVRASGVIIWFSDLAQDYPEVTVNELELVGQRLD